MTVVQAPQHSKAVRQAETKEALPTGFNLFSVSVDRAKYETVTLF